MPVIKLDELTDEQRKAYMLVHNKLTMNTGFDFSALTEELQSIGEIDMLDFGFSTFELETDDSEIIPEAYDSEYLKEYGEGDTLTTVITISCANAEEVEFMTNLLKEGDELKKLYRAKAIMERYAEDSIEH